MRITAKQVKTIGIDAAISQLAGVITQLRLEDTNNMTPAMKTALSELSDALRTAKGDLIGNTEPMDRIQSGIWN